MDRLGKIRAKLTEQGLDGLIIFRPENRRYISGFTGSSGVLLVTQKDALLFTDFRYVEQATAQAPKFTVLKHAQVMWDSVAEHTGGLNTLGFEQDFLSFELHKLLTEKFQGCKLVPAGGIVETLRTIKDSNELNEMQKAADLADLAFSHILGFIQVGMTEQEVALELEFFMRKNGASGPSFDFIVASGSRSSLPHGVATEKVLAMGDFVTMDFGAVVNGYCSDITRTVVLGEPSEQQRNIYETVLMAQQTSLAAIKPGLTGKEVDKIARDIITGAGFGDNFGHGLGHSLGLKVHEDPRLSPTGDKMLEPGMVVTVEPGIYLPGWGGVRIEDMVLVTDSGYKVLTKSPKELIIL